MTLIGTIGMWTAIVALVAALAALAATVPSILRVQRRAERLQHRPSTLRLAALGGQISARASGLAPNVEALQQNLVKLERTIADAALATAALVYAVKQSADVVEDALDRTVPFLRGSFRR